MHYKLAEDMDILRNTRTILDIHETMNDCNQ